MRKIILFLFLILLPLSSCSDKSDPPTQSSSPGVRIGAVCKDGTTSTATGSGACSSHGGVDHWIYK